MAEGIAFDLVKEVLGKLGSALGDEIGLLRSFKDDADDLKSNFSAIQAVLHDAEERSRDEKESHALRDWVHKLKDAAYDADDLLDEIRTQAVLQQQPHEVQNENQLAKMVCDQLVKMVCDQFQSWMFKLKMAHRMKELREKIGKIEKQRHDFRLVEAGPRLQTEFKRPETTISVVDEEKIVGRDDDKEKIVKLLLEAGGDHDVSVISIVGLGGLGKTTLAQLAFNDGRVKGEQRFDLRVWVCVSTDFDMKTIAKAVTSVAQKKCVDLDNADVVARYLVEIFNQHRFLLVLDDVWNEEQDKWENMKVIFKDGKKGSKILVTTRSEKVAMIMKTVEPHRVKGLSDDDCWKLFKRRAFEEGEENDYPHLVEIGKQIVNKCGGLPLAVNALGSMMRFKNRTEDAWLAIRNNEIWTLKEEKTILPSLKLSYIQMPSALKRCFTYCSIFPKDSKIDKDDLIQQWIALGFISSHETSSSMEDIGNEYFNDLLWMSFLQNVMEDDEITCQMHDLVHDLAQSVAREEVAVIVGENSTSIPEGCRYASIHTRSIQQVPTTVKKKLRALQFGESAPPTTFYTEAKCLRLLALHDFKISMLPTSIGKLKLLRYLNLSRTDIQELPESITGLCNLQTLNLSYCREIRTLPKSLGSLANLRILNLSKCSYLPSLPESIGNLENLHILNLSECSYLPSLPESIGKLENLRILNLSKCSCLLSLPSSLCQLKNLHDLNLSNLDNWQTLPKSIGNLENLRILNLSNCSRLLLLSSSLCQLKNLRDLNLSNLRNVRLFPESIGNLENLRILNLSKCSFLPFSLLSSWLYQLKNLQDLNLSNIDNLRTLPESIGNLENLRILNLSNSFRLLSLPSSLCQLKNLHDLNLSDLYNLKTLPKSIGNLENLRILNLSRCSSLLSLPSSSSDLQHLEILDIRGCTTLFKLPNTIRKMTNFRELLISEDCLVLKAMPLGIGKLVSLSELPIFAIGKQDRVEQCASISELEHLNNLGRGLEIKGLENVTNPADAMAANLIEKKKLRSLKLKWNVLSAAKDMDTVQSAEEMDAVLENLQPHQNLEKLEIEGYAGGKFPSWMMNRIDSCLPNLVKIELVNIPRCSSLPRLGQLPLLRELSIRNMAAITNLGVEFDGDSHINESANKFPALRRLDSSDMPTKLKYLCIDGCSSLRYLPVHKMTTLRDLSIKDCPLLFDAGGDVRVNERSEPCFPTSVRELFISEMGKEFLSLIFKRPTMDSETPPNDGNVVSLQQPNMVLRDLRITNCQQLTCLPDGLWSLTALESLTIKDCEDLERIEDWLGELTKLKDLNISRCSSLLYLPVHKMTTLSWLSIEDCPLLFNACGAFVGTNVDHIRIVIVDGSSYKYKKQMNSSSDEEEVSSLRRRRRVGREVGGDWIG